MARAITALARRHFPARRSGQRNESARGLEHVFEDDHRLLGQDGSREQRAGGSGEPGCGAPGAVIAAPLPAPVVAAPVPAAPPAAEAPIPRLAELPESTRRELPKLVISGSVYSDDPASRFVMVNGEVLREGAKLGADLVLEQIGARELVLRFKGQRYRLPV